MGYYRFLVENRLFLLAGFLLTFTSSYGQTYFISLFAGEIKTSFDLSDGEWGLIYTIGTTASAITMIWAGALTDRFRVRHLSLMVMVLLALACVSMSLAQTAVMLVGVVYALRLMGQGMMSQLGAVAMSRWFVATRGRAISLASMGFSVGQAVLPIIFVALLAVMDWRVLWLVAGLCVVVVIPVMQVLLRQERTPQSMAQTDQALGMQAKHWSRADALRHPLFYLLAPLIIGPSAWGTALFFHQVHLTEVKGWSLASYVALMPIYTVVTIAVTFATGWAVDRFGVSRIVPLVLLPFGVAFLILAGTPSILGAGVGLAIFAIGQGMQGTAVTAFWAVYYGTRHLGAIKSAVAALMVFGSAIGPGISGVFIDLGVDFPGQMVPYALFYFAAAACAWIGVRRYRHDLSDAA